jgi:type IV pilus assembly protein PilV
MKPFYTHRAQGFTLVEVMVAVIVICIGLLGIAKMQALSMNNMSTSRQRSLAAIEAASLAAAMHSNRAYWASTPAATITLAVGGNVTSSDANVLAGQTMTDIGAPNACVGTNNGVAKCVPLNLAAYDLAIWVNDLDTLLPHATATISCPPVINAPMSCTIQIAWTEQAVSMTSQEAAQQAAGNVGQFESPVYELYVEP